MNELEIKLQIAQDDAERKEKILAAITNGNADNLWKAEWEAISEVAKNLHERRDHYKALCLDLLTRYVRAQKQSHKAIRRKNKIIARLRKLIPPF